MKSLIFSILSFLNPGPEDHIQLIMDVGFKIENAQLYHIVDDINHPVLDNFISYDDSQLTLLVKEYQDYLIVLNDDYILTLTVEAYEPVDERDYTISFNGTYEFNKGIMCLKFDNELTSK